MVEVTRGISFVFIYINDLLVASPTSSDHHRHQKKPFSTLLHYVLVISTSKCVFGTDQMEFLGHLIFSQRIWPWIPRSKLSMSFRNQRLSVSFGKS